MSRHRPPCSSVFAILILSAAGAGYLFGQAGPAPSSRRWTTNRTFTLPGLGRGQGLTFYEGKLYALGDAETGVIVEYDTELRPTGRRIALTRDGRDLIPHPTGLAFHPQYGALLGDSSRGLQGRRAMIYQIDWPRALAEGNLDHAVRGVIADDLARAGSRPAFVRVRGRWLVATADYDPRGQIRLYDPEKIRPGGRTSEAGVLAGAVPLQGRTQSLVWEDETGRLYCVQNPRNGRGWRVVALNLEKALAGGRWDAPGAIVETVEFPYESELEGLAFLPGGRVIFLTSEKEGNAREGRVEPARP